eukprot:scaffold656_cov390-Prasinococcus_capsulatus_cf.AAC.2
MLLDWHAHLHEARASAAAPPRWVRTPPNAPRSRLPRGRSLWIVQPAARACTARRDAAGCATFVCAGCYKSRRALRTLPTLPGVDQECSRNSPCWSWCAGRPRPPLAHLRTRCPRSGTPAPAGGLIGLAGAPGGAVPSPRSSSACAECAHLPLGLAPCAP